MVKKEEMRCFEEIIENVFLRNFEKIGHFEGNVDFGPI